MGEKNAGLIHAGGVGAGRTGDTGSDGLARAHPVTFVLTLEPTSTRRPLRSRVDQRFMHFRGTARKQMIMICRGRDGLLRS